MKGLSINKNLLNPYSWKKTRWFRSKAGVKQVRYGSKRLGLNHKKLRSEVLPARSASHPPLRPTRELPVG